MPKKRSDTKTMILAVGFGLAAYITLPPLLRQITNNPENSVRIEELGQKLEDDRAEHLDMIRAIENIADGQQRQQLQINTIDAVLRQNYVGYQTDQNAQAMQSLRPNEMYGYQSPVSSPYGQPEFPRMQQNLNSYPSHDIYFSWQANDKGVANSFRSYSVSVNTGKVWENLQNFGEWVRSFGRR